MSWEPAGDERSENTISFRLSDRLWEWCTSFTKRESSRSKVGQWVFELGHEYWEVTQPHQDWMTEEARARRITRMGLAEEIFRLGREAYEQNRSAKK